MKLKSKTRGLLQSFFKLVQTQFSASIKTLDQIMALSLIWEIFMPNKVHYIKLVV
jgi:hypothetical protein